MLKIFSNRFKKHTSDPYQEGDVIYAERRYYRHFGIYSGNNNVINFADREGRFGIKANIVESSLEDFSKGNKIYVYQFNETVTYSPKQTLKRARSRLGETGYNIFTNNCEHFALWCKTGREQSDQVQDIFERVFRMRCEVDELKIELINKISQPMFDFFEKITVALEGFEENIDEKLNVLSKKYCEEK